MQIQACLEEYKLLKEYFEPDYKRRNKALITFKLKHPTLLDEHVYDLKKILDTKTVGPDQYFVADLLYLYRGFSRELFEPMINCAIIYREPSFSRIFLRPCMSTFGVKDVADLLTEKFLIGDFVTQIGISYLLYWLWHKDYEDVRRLYEVMIDYANRSNNIVEIYLYSLCFRSKLTYEGYIPNGASDLFKVTKGIPECEDLLKQLGWIRE
ncbi:hypothetical protein MRBLMN1_004864 [Chitinophaga ginsengisegetis]|uniref:hypothetical protein n=1 Tax=Chitinophaga ginsengisegetis TaxID=393003 RepID=UPI00344986F0